MKRSRIYIVDYDLISPLGSGRNEVYQSVLQQVTAEAQIERFPAEGLPVTHGCEVKEDLAYLYAGEQDELGLALKYDRKLELLSAVYNLMDERLLKCLAPCEPDRAGVI